MPDDFQDLKEQMLAHAGTLKGFFFTVGMTLLQCQAFEDRLRQYKLVVFQWKPGMAEPEFAALLAKSRKVDTLGSLLKDLAKKVTIDPKAKELLDELLAERNWFIHHFEYQLGNQTFDNTAMDRLVQRMRDLQDRSIHLQKQFAELMVAWTEKQGFSRAEIDAETRTRLEQHLKGTS